MSFPNPSFTILVVDDDPGLARLVERDLRQVGYQTASAGSGREASEWLKKNRADLLLLDLKLPDVAGHELIDEMASEGRSVPFIVITGQGDERVAVDMMKRGALDYVVKDMHFISLIPSVVRRVLDQLELRQHLDAAEKSKRDLVAALPIAVYACDGDGRITLFNEAAAALWGREPVVGDDCWCGSYRLYDMNGSPISHDQCPMAQAIHQGRSIRDEEIIVERPDHTRRYVLAFPEPTLDASGAVVGAINMLVDITERKQLKEAETARDAFEYANRAKADFLATLSHELRTPLGPVLLLADEGSQNQDLPASVRADFSTIAKNVILEARLIDDLLDLTRITNGKISLDRGPVKLHEVLQEALNTVREKFQQKRLVVILELDGGNPWVMGDAVRLQQVFWNVLKNAAKFTPAEGRIQIETHMLPANGAVIVKVTDSGIGLASEKIASIFEPYQQGEHASLGGSRAFGGLGLGLSISRKLLDLHSGRISATSPGRGKGSVFTIELPLLEPAVVPAETDGDADASKQAMGEAPEQRPNSRILLVEDDEVSRLTLSGLLQRRRYNVIAAASVLEALEIADGGAIDVLVTDIGLPDGDGYQLVGTLKKRFPSLTGIAMSGYGMEEDIRRSQEAGFIAHLVKPVRMAVLQEALAKAIASSGIRQ